MSEHKMYRVGLVGAGYVSEFHIRALRGLANVSIVGITDIDFERARAVAERFELTAFATLKGMAEKGLDVVHVLTPPATHAAVALEAIGLGCHVLVEKPLASSVEECDAIAAEARRAGVSVCVDHSLLRDFFVESALRRVKRGEIGDVVSAEYVRSGDCAPYRGGPLPPQYRDGGFPFRDLGVHALYVMEAFLGEIRDVQARFMTRWGDPNLLYDEWSAFVEAQRGHGQIQLSWNVKPYQHYLVVRGTRGVLKADLHGMTVTVRRSTRLPKFVEHAWNSWKEGWQICTQVPWNLLRVIRGRIMRYHGLTMVVREFYDKLASGKPPPVSAEEARSLVLWTERAAREADAAKAEFLKRFPAELSAKVLVTGAGGFIGGRLMKRLLAEGQRVRILVRREPSIAIMSDPRVEVVIGDLGDPEAVERAVAGTELVYHVGAAIRGSAADFERGTVAGTRNVVDSALRHGVRRLVYISSLSVLHAVAGGTKAVFREDWPLEQYPQRRGEYTRTKLEAEKIVTRAVRERGLPAVTLRPGLVIGEGAPCISPAVALRAGQRLVIFGSGRGRLPLVYVEDVVDAIVEAGRREAIEGEIFHIVDEQAVTQEQLAREFVKASGQNLRIVHMPRAAIYSLAACMSAAFKLLRRAAPLSIYRVRSALALRRCDCTVARQRLGWTPRVGVEAGLGATLAALREAGSPVRTRKQDTTLPLREAGRTFAGAGGDGELAAASAENRAGV